VWGVVEQGRTSVVKNLLVTGRPGVGKTSLVQKVVAQLRGWNISGFTTGELRDARGQRVGFAVVTLDGQRGILAHVKYHDGPRVGRYRVDVPAFEALALPSLSLAAGTELLVADEIGKMECFSKAFKERIVRVLDSSLPVLATIALQSDSFMHTIKQRPDVDLLEVTVQNRDRLVSELTGRLCVLKASVGTDPS
jgi:nucleoside-triphosphatase